jgi:hypothetical protein
VAAIAPSTQEEMRTSAAIDTEQRKRAQDPWQRGRPSRMQIGPVEFGERARQGIDDVGEHLHRPSTVIELSGIGRG